MPPVAPLQEVTDAKHHVPRMVGFRLLGQELERDVSVGEHGVENRLWRVLVVVEKLNETSVGQQTL
jgi:hypothetical protein